MGRLMLAHAEIHRDDVRFTVLGKILFSTKTDSSNTNGSLDFNLKLSKNEHIIFLTEKM